jgi:hypothetical protein
MNKLSGSQLKKVLPEMGKSLFLEWIKRPLILIETGNKP